MEGRGDGGEPPGDASPENASEATLPAEPATPEPPTDLLGAEAAARLETPGPGRPQDAPPPMATLRAHTLRDRIVEHLRATQTDSISGIARFLANSGEAPVHRLTVAGYLQAMAEAGVLRELDRPPSKLYQLQNPETHWSLHQRVHRVLQEMAVPEADQARHALAILQRTLGRPVFQVELQHAGIQHVPNLPRVVVGDAVRRHYRDLFTRRATPRIEVPPRDPLLGLEPHDPAFSHPLVDEALRRVLLRATASEHLVAERPAGPQQVPLDVGPP